MTQHDGDPSEREERLNEAIASYLRCKRSAAPPDRQAWLARYAEFASELAEFFADQDEIDTMAARLHPRPSEGSSAGDAVRPMSSRDEDGFLATATFRVEPSPVRGDRYVVKKFHGRGGMGEIWVAEDSQIGRRVALKKLRGERTDQRERFLAEAQITGQLEHPGIVPLHDLGVDEEGHPFYVMKYVKGETLKDAILDYHCDEPSPAVPRELQQLRLLEVFVDLCHAVAFAHSRGVLHRDLKPSNIMLGQFGETLLLDWGLAKVKDEPEKPGDLSYVHVSSSSGSPATQDGSVIGSPAYMSPEMAEGRLTEADERADVYLLGATLYEILTGRPPREGSSNLEMLELARTVSPPAPRKLVPSVPRALEAICLKAMPRRPQDRYPSVLEVAEDMQRYLAGEPVSAYRERLPQRAWRWCKRHRRALKRAAAAVILLACTMFVYGIIRENGRWQAVAQARSEVEQFHHLADEMWYYATNADPVTEHAPYYDLDKGLCAGQSALQMAENWGPGLEHLPLFAKTPELRDKLKGDLYDLHLLLVQARLQTAQTDDQIEELLTLLDCAATFYEPTQSYYRLRSECSTRLGKEKLALEEQKRADDPHTPTTALDHFLNGEQHRTVARRRLPDADPWQWTVQQDHLLLGIDEYRRALRLKPDHFWSRLQLGRCLLGVGHREEASEALGACIAVRGESPWGFSARGIALALCGRFEDAYHDLDQAIAIDPEFYPARLNRGVAYWLDKQPQKALADFDAVLQAPTEKRLVEAAFYRGQVYLGQGKCTEALRDFDLVVQEKPELYHVYQPRATVHFLLGEDYRGMADLNTYLKLLSGGSFDADGWQAYCHRGRFLEQLLSGRATSAAGRGRTLMQLALAEFHCATEQRGCPPQVFADYGRLLEGNRQTQKALEVYSQGLILAPEDTRLRNLRGWVYASRPKQYPDALVDFTTTLRADPQNAEACTGIGFVSARLKEPRKAQDSAAEALLHGHGEYKASHNVACIYAELSQTETDRRKYYEDLALVELRRAVDLSRPDGSGRPKELGVIEHEQSFPRSLRERPEFQQLLRQGGRPTNGP